MIFVSLGTSMPFDRLLQAVDRIAPEEELVLQTGATSYRPSRGSCFEFLAVDEFVALVRRARIVVMHAGAGSVLTALANGKRPVVVPRLAAHGEAVDDHQVAFARRMSEAGLVTLVEDVDDIPAVVAGGSGVAEQVLPSSGLLEDLRTLIEARVGARRAAA